ncbi:phospholipase A2 inhibitor and Ly6/PLAUR domain-containing protein-like isoform X1 [Mixophyes fleayi]|uniref:phospholipase A2 inhibitor and Ly6/PLAUR domain-containing protein-like isoform X1 n=1 Tax=Mixophyes fleayi TaxID=3061075 RepID=UPI003F4DA927
MKSILISLSIICAVTWTVDAIKCYRCLKTNSDTCVGELVHCPNATQCMVMSELSQFRNETYHSIKKDCNPGFPCKDIYYSNFDTVFLRTNVHCCSEDNCNTDSYKMPPDSIERKGKICPSCFEDGLTECIGNNTERCTHPDDPCADFIGKIRDPGNNIRHYTYRGCISPLACKYKMKALVGVKEIETIRLTCYPGK